MAVSSENLERKFSLDEVLLYQSAEPRIVNVRERLGEDIHDQLWAACEAGDIKTVKEILETNNIDVNARLNVGYTPLLIAAEHNQVALVNFLLNQAGIDVSVAQRDGGTALIFALRVFKDFESANYEMARCLMNAGADINQVALNNTILLHAWYRGNQGVANALVLLGASISISEDAFNANEYRMQQCGADGVVQQIALSKQHLEAYLENARHLGLALGDICFQFMKNKANSQEIARFLVGGSLGAKAVHNGCEMALKALAKQFPAPAPTNLLPIPRSLFFMADVRNNLSPEMIDELAWQLHEQQYNHDHPGRAEQGYGAGAMVVCTPKP